jgi:hypothetical protein
MDVWELNPELDSLWLKTSATLGRGGSLLLKVVCGWAVPLFIYTLAFVL